MIDLIGFILIMSSINIFLWIVLGAEEFGLRDSIRFAAGSEIFLLLLAVGCYCITGGN